MNTLDCDVLVIGGGPAGVAAAVAAGRAGARVVLLERYGFLGGLATAGSIGAVCGLYLRDTAGTRPELVAEGWLREFSERLAVVSNTTPTRLENGLWVLPFVPPAFERMADAAVRECGRITLLVHATFSFACAEDSRLSEVRALVWNDLVTIHPVCVVDCTGEATAAALAGGAVAEGHADQASALVFVMENVAPGFAQPGMLDLLRALRRGVDEGELSAGSERLALVPGAWGRGRQAFKLNLLPAGSGLPGWRRVTAGEREARALVDEVQRFLIANVAAFRRARFSYAAPQLGVRTSRCIRGVATLTDEAVLACRKADDGIARGCWPMERWGAGPQTVMTYFAERDYFEIPIGCLRPAGLSNVLAAGRCLSAMPGALASARVIGTCLATGWAAGAAAACQADGKSDDVAVAAIRAAMNS
ncbi:MAG TPA: FAD-dependent oxidoreductase [Verrucomicrobiae bacterium]